SAGLIPRLRSLTIADAPERERRRGNAMTDPLTVVDRCNPLARQLILTASLACAALVAFHVPSLKPLRVPISYLLPLAIGYACCLAVRLFRNGPGDLPPLLFAIGCAVTVGGFVVDLVATVVQAPDLQHESNPVARALLDSGHPLAFVYALAAVAQGL